MERVEIDGVTVLWADGPPPLRARLVFGCGRRDEELDALGITGLVRALAIREPAGTRYEHDAMTGLMQTWFEVTGTPADVVGHLTAVCAALRSLPPARLPEVAARLDPADRRTELDTVDVTVDVLLGRRFGPHGLGLARWPATAYGQFTAEEVRRHAARYFVAGNAVLLLTGPPPAGLRLPLTAGPRVAHLTPPPVTPDGPRWCTERVDDVGVTLHAGHGVEWYTALHILHARVVAAAARTGPRRVVHQEMITVDATRQEAMLVLRADRGVLAGWRPPGVRGTGPGGAAELLWHELRRFAADGPTPQELAAEIQATATAYQRADVLDATLERAGDAALFGVPYRRPADDLTDLTTLTAATVAGLAAQWLRTALMVVPAGARPRLPGMVEDRCPRRRVVPAGRAFRRRLPARLVSARARGERLVLAPDGLSIVDGQGDVHTVRFVDVLAMEQDGPARVVFGRYGCVIEADPARFTGARHAVRALDASVPPRRRLGRTARRR